MSSLKPDHDAPLKGLRLLISRLRGRGIALATATSILGRVLSSASTIVAMPIALKTLGEARFGAFLVLAGVVNWINLGGFGLPSALGKLLAAGGVTQEKKARLFGGALAYGALSITAISALVTIAFTLWANALYKTNLALQNEIINAGIVMILLVAIQMLLQISEGIRIGSLQGYILNIVRICGSIFSFIVLLILPPHMPNVMAFVISLNGGLLLGAALNAVLVFRETPPDFRHLRKDTKEISVLVASGSSFAVIGVGSFFQTNIPVLILSLLYGSAAVVDFGLYIRLLFIMAIALGMLTTPLWPAIINARAQEDKQWMNRTLINVGILVNLAGLVAAFFVGIGGPLILNLWAHVHQSEGPLLNWAFGVYFLQWAWSHYWATVLMGFGHEKLASRIIVAEGLLIAILGSSMAHWWGPTGMVLGLNLAFALVSTWLLPWLVLREGVNGLGLSGLLSRGSMSS